MTSPVEVDIQNEFEYVFDVRGLECAAQTTARLQGVTEPSTVTIVVTNDETVSGLNKRFRGIDAPTDVLSFPSGEESSVFDGEPRYLGDLVIAFPYASAQAGREGHTLNDSLGLLVVHGMLHVLGFDHHTPEARAEMWRAQEEVLLALNISPEIVPALENVDHG